MVGKFICRRCDKKKSKHFAFGITFTKLHSFKSCPGCGKMKQRGVFVVEGMWGDKMTYVGCLECNPVMDDDENIWGGDRVCRECFFEWKRKQNDAKKNDLLTNVTKENQELRQQLAQVQKQLAEVLAELKKLKDNINGKDSEKLEQQIVKNEKLIKNSENVSLNEVQQQVNKSENLVNEVKIHLPISHIKNQESNKLQEPNKNISKEKIFGILAIVSAVMVAIVIITRKKIHMRSRE